MEYYFLNIVKILAFFLTINSIYNYVRVLLYKSKQGCKPGVKLPQFDRILGLDIYRIQVKALKEKVTLKLAKERYDQYGNTWSVHMMGKTFYNTIEPENIKTILATDFKKFGIWERQLAYGPLLGQGIFTTDGAQWEHSRSLVRPNFTRSQVADLGTFEAHIQTLMTRFPTDGSTIDLQPLFFSLTLDSATEFLFGQSVDSLNSAEDSEQVKFGKDFDYAQNCLTMRSRLGKLVFLYRNKLFDQACQNVHAFVDEIVRTELARTPPEDAEKSNDGNGDANRYVFLTELVKSTRDPVRLRDELLNVLLAGRDTTASLLSNTFHALVRRPDIFRKLKAEIDQLNGEKPDYETLRNLKYLKQILNESLRLYPVVPINARYAKEDTTIPLGGGPHGTSPLFIPRGALVAYSAYSMHRLQSIYGPDADIFRPERWDPSENLRPGWGYLPFNGGPRICVGQQFALTEASYTIVRLCQEYRIEDREGGEWIPKVALTTACGNGVKVVMEKI